MKGAPIATPRQFKSLTSCSLMIYQKLPLYRPLPYSGEGRKMTMIPAVQTSLSSLPLPAASQPKSTAEGAPEFSGVAAAAAVAQSPMQLTDRPKVEDPAILIPFYESQVAVHKSLIESTTALIPQFENDYEVRTKMANDWLADGDTRRASLFFDDAESAKSSVEAARMHLFELGKQAPYIENLEQRLRELKGQI